ALAWPFLIAAPPCAYVGGRIQLPIGPLAAVLGVVLLMSAVRLVLPAPSGAKSPRPPALPIALVAGAVLGLLAGLTGTGGGIFLTPLLLLAGWATPKTAAAASIVFIAGNSISGLAGFIHGGGSVPWHAGSLFAVALLGGFLGSRLGSLHLSPATIRRLLAAVLFVASGKLLSVAFTA
ncbi:MAG: sulfite exporter TauE/SafE family protein, partial [Planctomycetota bacterium]|nr:sulfite exporter TauE/SafE family protein [Planctomycetota bacterium]